VRVTEPTSYVTCAAQQLCRNSGANRRRESNLVYAAITRASKVVTSTRATAEFCRHARFGPSDLLAV